MLGTRQLLVIVLCGAAIQTPAQANCPDAERLSPCTCDDDGINCMRATSTEQIIHAFATPGPDEHPQLWMQKTGIDSFPQGILGSFKFLRVNIDMNVNLTTFELDALNQSRRFLSYLSLHDNALDAFDFQGITAFPKLTVLNLGKNQIRSIPQGAFNHPKLEDLILTSNPITTVGEMAFARLPRLKNLHLSRTRLATLGPNSMFFSSGYPKLQVNLMDARIQQISATAFSHPAPWGLFLNQNNLTTFEQTVFLPLMRSMLQVGQAAGEFPRLSLRGNPFSCQGMSYAWLLPLRSNMNAAMLLRDFMCDDGTPFRGLTYNRLRVIRPRPWNP